MPRMPFSCLPPPRATSPSLVRARLPFWTALGDPCLATASVGATPVFWRSGEFHVLAALAGLALVGLLARFIETRRYRQRLIALARQSARDAERTRIARDMHDQLGADLTRIKLLGELVERDLGTPALAAQHARRISDTARELARTMDEIVWAVDPRKDHLRNLVSYLGSFTEEFLGATPLRCRLDLPAAVPEMPVSAELRHHLFLAVKEALHNAVKHAEASEIRLRVTLAGETLTLVIEDNGRGFAAAAPGESDRHGLANLHRRLAAVNGSCQVTSQPGQGTRVTLSAPLRERVGPA